uniref:Uncharacterized protein n=1 Tax=Mola mola TaxID=94237 RepID=A0A3Q3W5H7_MOLML
KVASMRTGEFSPQKVPCQLEFVLLQDELQAAISARSRRTQMEQYSYSDDFSEDEDDFLNGLLKSRREKAGATGRSKAKINDFGISDDGSKHGRTKRVSFLKTQRIRSPSEDTWPSDSCEHKLPDSSVCQNYDCDNSCSPQQPIHEDETQFRNGDGESTDHQNARESTGAEEKSSSVLEETSQTPQLPAADLSRLPSAGLFTLPHVQLTEGLSLLLINCYYSDSAAGKELPRPKPRQRTLGMSLQTREKMAADAESQDVSRPHTSSASIPFSSDTASSTAVSSFTTNITRVTSSSHSKTSQRSQSLCPKKVESKYLGSLKVLDRKVCLQDSQPQAADCLRAAVYQVWLQNKKQKSRQNMQLKKEEEMLKEKKKREEECTKEDAVASYEAWKERKAESLRAKAKEKQDEIRKQQREMEEKEEKRQSAKKVFEKWKLEHDHTRKEKHRKQKEAESKLQLKKQETEEERKHNSKSKSDFLHEKVKMERKAVKNQAEEEQYLKEERDKMALEMYESWLRQQEERRIQEILRDSPPPPWSPPNKTVPFRR